ncbi:ABC transporter ATP-binding protein [Bacillus massiliigorillae]|uniref:ABC transporter ATP-binding protein n=1 Tax=Bacillus massiliigorillae TaxID=1243664 RepID=UPI0003A64159|nr:ABC transporter ATP-binding protein [Bacillus massiliigorillae]
MIAVEARNIAHHVGQFALQNINLTFPKGQVTAIVGPNGSGKSTFLKIVSQLLNLHEGYMFVHNKPIQHYKQKEFAQILSMLPQSKQALPDLTVEELISFGRYPYKGLFQQQSSNKDKEIVQWAMNITGTTKHRERMFHQLSGGEQQKVRIAMALAQKTDIILLDEPTTFLDLSHQLDVMEMLQQINIDYGITIIMVLHDLQQAATYCHNMIAMKQGRVAQVGQPKQILTPQFLKEVYDIEACIKFEEDFPIIIPKRRGGKKDDHRNKQVQAY